MKNTSDLFERGGATAVREHGDGKDKRGRSYRRWRADFHIHRDEIDTRNSTDTASSGYQVQLRLIGANLWKPFSSQYLAYPPLIDAQLCSNFMLKKAWIVARNRLDTLSYLFIHTHGEDLSLRGAQMAIARLIHHMYDELA